MVYTKRVSLPKAIKILLISLGALVFLNILALDWFWFADKSKEKEATVEQVTEEKATIPENCALSCQQTISEKIQEELAKTSPSAGQSSVLPTNALTVKTPTTGQQKILYIPLASNGNTVLTVWTDIVPSEFYFDLTNYPGIKEVRFETYLQAVNGSAKVYARLYDATNKRGVDYSDLSTANGVFSRLESSAITIWRGNNKYTVQLRSENGTEVQLKDAKLKIIY